MGCWTAPGRCSIGAGMTKRTTYIGLDVVRFLAALSVTLYHFVYFNWITDAEMASRLDLPQEPFRWGFVGVPVFFVLSGFVIAFSANGRSVAEFVKGRALRLYPVAWICATITLVVTECTWGDYVRSAVLWPIGPWVSGVYWTLAIEIIFYAVVAVCLWREIRITSLGYALTGLGALYWIGRTIDFVLGGHLKELFAPFETPIGSLTLVTQAMYFGVGITLWSISSNGPNRIRYAAVALALIAGTLALFASARFRIHSEGGAVWQSIELPAFWLASVALIGLAIRFNGAIPSRLEKPARTLGLLTYPLYLVHSELGSAVIRWSAPAGGWAAISLAIAVVIAAAYLVMKIEPYLKRPLAAVLHARQRMVNPPIDLP